MDKSDKITIDVFKVVAKSIAESDDLGIMLNHLAQLLVAALEIKGCSIFVLNPESEELERLASFGLSTGYLSKGPLKADKSVGCTLRGEPVIIRDVTQSDRLQYPAAAINEGVAAIVSMPIFFLQEVIGVLRLYHHEPWDISDRDVDSLLILGENIGLAMMFTRLVNSVQSIKEAVRELPMELGRLLDTRERS
ncbi:MAG: GAF domain-containing protein [Deltaproteobacteria bacterium]|nr:GAF domain-containing protein [Deltaproteobacteria bacterium]